MRHVSSILKTAFDRTRIPDAAANTTVPPGIADVILSQRESTESLSTDSIVGLVNNSGLLISLESVVSKLLFV